LALYFIGIDGADSRVSRFYELGALEIGKYSLETGDFITSRAIMDRDGRCRVLSHTLYDDCSFVMKTGK